MVAARSVAGRLYRSERGREWNWNIRGEQLDQLLHKAIIDALGDEGRDLLIKETVAYLTTKETGGYGPGRTPLIRALHVAASSAATRFAQEKIENDPEFQAMLRGVFERAVEQFMQPKVQTKLVDAISSALVRAFEQ